MRRKDIIIIILVAAIIVFIAFLTIKNDMHFNERRAHEHKKNEQQDSITIEQTNRLRDGLNVVTIQLDSMKETQKRNDETERQHYEITKHSLDQIKRVQRQVLNEMK